MEVRNSRKKICGAPVQIKINNMLVSSSYMDAAKVSV